MGRKGVALLHEQLFVFVVDISFFPIELDYLVQFSAIEIDEMCIFGGGNVQFVLL